MTWQASAAPEPADPAEATVMSGQAQARSGSEPARKPPRRPRRHWKLPVMIVAAIVGLLVILYVRGCVVAHQETEDPAVHQMRQTARVLVAGTPYADLPVEQLPAYSFDESGSMFLVSKSVSFDVPARYASIVESNVAEAGWTVNIRGCLTRPYRDGPPCAVTNAAGDYVALADYETVDVLYVLVLAG
jgi:hypothetical protein